MQWSLITRVHTWPIRAQYWRHWPMGGREPGNDNEWPAPNMSTLSIITLPRHLRHGGKPSSTPWCAIYYRKPFVVDSNFLVSWKFRHFLGSSWALIKTNTEHRPINKALCSQLRPEYDDTDWTISSELIEFVSAVKPNLYLHFIVWHCKL